MTDPAQPTLDYERSARRDIWVWAVLLVGSIFVYTGHSVDPLKNCDESGECAPRLVPVATVMGWCAVAMAIGLIAANPRRGCRAEVSGDLVWWRNRTARNRGDTGRIPLASISRICLDRRSDDDRVSLYDAQGERLAHFDQDLIPWPYDRWIARLRERHPHIELQELG